MKRQVTFNTGDTMYHLEIDRANPYVLSGGSPGRIKRMAECLDHPEVIVSDRGLVTVHGEYGGLPITAFSTGMGPASVSIVMPEIIEACDDPKMTILRLGTSGGLQKHLKIGDLVVTTDVERAESTSDKIMHPGYKAVSDNDVRRVLEETAQEHKLPSQSVHVGRTKTTDDIYFDALASKGYKGPTLAVSMEFSVYCALRDRYNRDFEKEIRVGEVLMISDIVVAEEHPDMTEFLANKKEIEAAHIKIGLEALLRLAR